jgi:hypothetical protein
MHAPALKQVSTGTTLRFWYSPISQLSSSTTVDG